MEKIPKSESTGQQTTPKRWFANRNMTSFCDVTNSVCPVTKTTIRHCSTLAFVRGAYDQAVAPGITRPPHATGRGAIEICLSEKGALAKKRFGNTGLHQVQNRRVSLVQRFVKAQWFHYQTEPHLSVVGCRMHKFHLVHNWVILRRTTTSFQKCISRRARPRWNRSTEC